MRTTRSPFLKLGHKPQYPSLMVQEVILDFFVLVAQQLLIPQRLNHTHLQREKVGIFIVGFVSFCIFLYSSSLDMYANSSCFLARAGIV